MIERLVGVKENEDDAIFSHMGDPTCAVTFLCDGSRSVPLR